jgi:hypothetical protein
VSSSIDIANIITKSIENTDSQLIQNQTIEEKILEDQQICKIFDFYNNPDKSKVGIENDFERICKYKDSYENLKNRFKGKNSSFTKLQNKLKYLISIKILLLLNCSRQMNDLQIK